MGYEQRFNINHDNHNTFKPQRIKKTETQLDSFSTFFAVENSMGNNHSYQAAEREQPTRDFLSFFNRLGGYNVYDILSSSAKSLKENKEMAALVIKFTVILSNVFGIYLFFYWLFIDFAGIKVFLTSVGVLAYGGMKLYEKYLDIKKKKRQDAEEQENFHLKHGNKK